jgi:hypothetical protein
MPDMGYACIDCNNVFIVNFPLNEIECPQCHSDNVLSLNIKECEKCEEIRLLQNAQNIRVAPLFWQGKGRRNIPLVMMGVNPSLVGSPNEPQRDCDFRGYFNYYQFRSVSEAEGRKLRHWGICHNIAKKLIRSEVPRWHDYVLMEVIHCFFNREEDLDKSQRLKVAKTCFNNHICKMLMLLNPKMVVVLGKTAYESLGQYLEPLPPFHIMEIKCQPDSGNSIKIPVLLNPHPNNRSGSGPYLSDTDYQDFKDFCDNFNYEI